jgi:hypothetical protein
MKTLTNEDTLYFSVFLSFFENKFQKKREKSFFSNSSKICREMFFLRSKKVFHFFLEKKKEKRRKKQKNILNQCFFGRIHVELCRAKKIFIFFNKNF